ncbi:DUF905 family protein [Pantoea sp. A4]|uniref:DUF905 family protein n=1 Tax=Pantoea sp. A4 TaxID=1225184 RepID=UPI00037EBA4D|nr:DUF905 family protein [Pantoea sp. A4]
MTPDTLPTLPDGSFTRAQAKAVEAAYDNVTIENDKDFHFQLVIRDGKGRMVWRAFNFDHEAGYWLNRNLEKYGVPAR